MLTTDRVQLESAVAAVFAKYAELGQEPPRALYELWEKVHKPVKVQMPPDLLVRG